MLFFIFFIIPIIIITTFVIMGKILKEAINFRKEQEELYEKKKAIIENQYEQIKNKKE